MSLLRSRAAQAAHDAHAPGLMLGIGLLGEALFAGLYVGLASLDGHRPTSRS